MIKTKEIIVLGAGISGLSLSWFLKERYGDAVKIKILEQSQRIGGWIKTLKKGDFLFELGPRSCRPHGDGIETLKLIEALQLQDEVIIADPSSKKRYLYQNKQLILLPEGFYSLLFSPFFKKVAKALWNDWISPKGKGEDEAVYDFISRRLSSEVAEELIDPWMSGIYAGDSRQLSILSCIPNLLDWEQQFGSILKGMLFGRKMYQQQESPFIQSIRKHPIFSFKKGMETLTLALAKKLKADIHLGTEVVSILMENGKAAVRSVDGRVHLADSVFSCLPPQKLSLLLRESCTQAAHLLRSIPVSSIATVNLGYNHTVLNRKGFGYLVPSKEKEEILGVVWDSCTFPHQQLSSHTCMTVMWGGTRHPHLCHLSKAELLHQSLEVLSKHLGITSRPQVFHVEYSHDAIPQFLVGHQDKLKQLQLLISKEFPFLHVHGSYFGVSVNACIANAKKIVSDCKLFEFARH